MKEHPATTNQMHVTDLYTYFLENLVNLCSNYFRKIMNLLTKC